MRIISERLNYNSRELDFDSDGNILLFQEKRQHFIGILCKLSRVELLLIRNISKDMKLESNKCDTQSSSGALSLSLLVLSLRHSV